MPKGKHLRGATAKEQRQYEHIKEDAQRSGRYGRRAKEVAARTVMKQHQKKKATRSKAAGRKTTARNTGRRGQR